MPYMKKKKFGEVDPATKRKLMLDPHMYSAPVAAIRTAGPSKSGGTPEALLWRTKTRCSSFAEWMELHDASDGAVLWRAEARFAERGSPVEVPVGKKGTHVRNDYLTAVRLYLESESTPRLMLVHRDREPNGLRMGGNRTISVR